MEASEGSDLPAVEGAAASGDGALAAEDAPASVESDPPDAAALAAAGNEVRLAVLRRLARAERDGEAPPTFTDLFEATDADTTAGFAYHLRQLDGHFVRAVGERADGESTAGDGAAAGGTNDADATDGRRGDGYRLTAAGRRLARALAAGAFTARPSFDPVALGEPCPHCGAAALAAACEDGDVAVACTACGRPVLSAPAPPGADADAPVDLVAAAGRHQRHRLSGLADGVCPDCGGTVAAALAEPPAAATAGLPGGDRRVRARFSCDACGTTCRAPVTHALLDHPAVVAFYREHGRDRSRPVWNVGEEWRETVLSTEPWCVRVSTALDGDVLSLFVDGAVEVRAVRRPSAS